MHPLVKEFFRKVEIRQRKLVNVSKRSGVGIVTMRTWKKTSNPTVPNLEAALNVVGYELHIRKKRKPSQLRRMKHGAQDEEKTFEGPQRQGSERLGAGG